MNKEEWLNYKLMVRDRLRDFALKIIELSDSFPTTVRGKILNYQLTKSGTSMYANYRAALRGRSKAEFFSKLSISVEEADETEMWLDLAITSGILSSDMTKELHTECVELLKILASMRKRSSEHPSQSHQSHQS